MPPKPRTTDFKRLFEQFRSLNSESGNECVFDCPDCEKPKLYVNRETGQYHCKVCDESGNHFNFIRKMYERIRCETTDNHYRSLKEKRGIGMQTLKRHGLAYDPIGEQWLIPLKNREGSIVNLQRYSPTTGQKYNLPGLPTTLYGLDKLSGDSTRWIMLCEGPFDAIALDHHLGPHRSRYDILATLGSLTKGQVEMFRNRKVRTLFDNDLGGEQHGKTATKLLAETGVVKELHLLKWPTGFPDGCDINDLVRDYPNDVRNIVNWANDNSFKAIAKPKLNLIRACDYEDDGKPIEWIWTDHIRIGSYISFSGKQGTNKSTIARDLAARVTTGSKMPDGSSSGIEPCHVIYLTAEDSVPEVIRSFKLAGGDLSKFHVLSIAQENGEIINLLEHLQELEQLIQKLGCRLVIVDGQNSVVGAPDISTDMKSRSNVSGKLLVFAQRLNITLIGIRNEDKEGRALGPQSMGDMARCVMRTTDFEKDGKREYKLEFEKVSDASRDRYPPIPFSVKDLGGSNRIILWNRGLPPIMPKNARHELAKIIAEENARATRKTVPKKRTKRGPVRKPRPR